MAPQKGNPKPGMAGIVTGQLVAKEKQVAAHLLRHTMTHAESLLWQRLRAGRLAGIHFRRQQVIEGFIVDFYCNSSGIVIEVDGDIHRGLVESDSERETVLLSKGLQVIRFTNTEIEENLEQVLESIATICNQTRSPSL